MLLADFPDEILITIAEELKTADLSSFLKTSHRFRAVLTRLITSAMRAMIERKNYLLIHAANRGHEPLAKMLLDNGADTEARSGGGMTPLYIAVECNDLKLVKLLIESGADLEAAKIAQAYGESWCLDTPLYAAVRKDCVPVAKLLLESGANTNINAFLTESVLHAAVARGSDAMVELLLDHGADINKRDVFVGSPLECANERADGGASIVKMLKDRGAADISWIKFLLVL